MTMSRPGPYLLCIVVAIAWVSAPFPRAEISVYPGVDQRPHSLVYGIGDDPDPFPPLRWKEFRLLPPTLVLNSAGEARGDGGPDLAWDSDGRPLAVWAWNVGGDHDVAFAEWDGTAWTSPTFLTAGLSDDLDPRVFVESDGTVHVAWWTAGTPSAVFVATRPAGGAWQAPIQVTGPAESGRRPSVAVLEDALLVAYERDAASPGTSQEVVVARRQPDGTFAVEYLVSTPRPDRLDVVLHSEAGRFWADWKEDGGRMGFASVGGGGWGVRSSRPWTNPSWIGVEDVRRSIRRELLTH
jgi:hypothetical protein